MQSGLEQAFDAIAAAMVGAARDGSAAIASGEAEQRGLIVQGDGKPSQVHIWERIDGNETLRFQWRWYDQSQAFSIRPDMNVLSLELRRAGLTVRKAEERFED